MIKKRICKSFLIVFTLFFCLSIPVSSKQNDVDKTNAEKIINFYKDDNDINYAIKNSEQLFSISNYFTYTIYELEPYGYAILLDNNNSLMEACYTQDFILPFDLDNNERVFYGGPCSYLIETNDGYINLFDNNYVSLDDIEYLIKFENNTIENINKKENNINFSSSVLATETTESKTVSTSYFSSLNNFGNNTNGTCVIIAEQMLLGYYDEFYNNSIVEAKYESGNGTNEAFHLLLQKYVYGTSTPVGTTFYNSKSGINKYLTERGLKISLTTKALANYLLADEIIKGLKDGKPVLGGMAKSLGGPKDHAYLIYGYKKLSTQKNIESIFTVNMGYLNSASNRSYKVNASWIDECAYIVNNCTSHTLTSWVDYNSTYHAKKCSKCIYITKQAHTINPSTGGCDICGRGNSTIESIHEDIKEY